MIDLEEQKICQRRGHDPGLAFLHQGWAQCKWCKIWVREVRTLEERESDPPKEELNPFHSRDK
jgi:hypothetical protein